MGEKRFIYTDEQIEWIKNNYSKFDTVKEALKEFNDTFSLNISETALWSKASRLGCKSSKFYTEEQKEFS